MQTYLPYILPAIITILSNVAFYLLVKKRIDNSIERDKISYSGVFKEKVDTYKKLLEEVHDLILKINQFQYLNEPTFNDEIRTAFNKLIRTYSIAKPFLSESILSLFERLTIDLQATYEAIAIGGVRTIGDVPQAEREKITKKYWEGVNKLRNGSLKEIEENIIVEMRRELQTV